MEPAAFHCTGDDLGSITVGAGRTMRYDLIWNLCAY
jgi:hypothetical protein